MKKFGKIIACTLTACTLISTPALNNSYAIKINNNYHSTQKPIIKFINSHKKDYNFCKDKNLIKLMENLGQNLTAERIKINPRLKKFKHYAIGDLDGDNVPEIAVFKQRNFKDIKDEGSLEVYKFDGKQFKLIDKISMNFDNSCYEIKIGKVSKDKNAIFLNNQVGAHSGYTYLYGLEKNKLKSLLNEKKVNCLSIYTSNEIKDIDNDGILEFSIYMADPESNDSSSAGSDKILVWYKWNGKDDVNVIKYQRKTYSKPEKTNKTVLNKYMETINKDMEKGLNYLVNNINKLSKKDATTAVEKYYELLYKNCESIDRELMNSIQNHAKKINKNRPYESCVLEKYDLKVEDLNNIKKLKDKSIFKDEKDLKEILIRGLNLGYNVHTSEGMYFFMVDDQSIIDKFEKNINYELLDYLKILAFDSNKPATDDAALVISRDELAKRINAIETYKITYPYSKNISKLKNLYEMYVRLYMYGDSNTPAFDYKTNKINDKILKYFKDTVKKDGYMYLTDILNEYLKQLEENKYILNDSIRDNLNKIIEL